jgi:hypothetical protein
LVGAHPESEPRQGVTDPCSPGGADSDDDDLDLDLPDDTPPTSRAKPLSMPGGLDLEDSFANLIGPPVAAPAPAKGAPAPSPAKGAGDDVFNLGRSDGEDSFDPDDLLKLTDEAITTTQPRRAAPAPAPAPAPAQALSPTPPPKAPDTKVSPERRRSLTQADKPPVVSAVKPSPVSHTPLDTNPARDLTSVRVRPGLPVGPGG